MKTHAVHELRRHARRPVGRPSKKTQEDGTTPVKKRKQWEEYPEFGVNERVLRCVLNGDDAIVGYNCATVVCIMTDKDGSKYKISLDKGGEESDVPENHLFTSVVME